MRVPIRRPWVNLPGVSAPPPFGGSMRTAVVRVDPDRLRAYGISPDDVISALTSGNTVSPSGTLASNQAASFLRGQRVLRHHQAHQPLRFAATRRIEDGAKIGAGF